MTGEWGRAGYASRGHSSGHFALDALEQRVAFSVGTAAIEGTVWRDRDGDRLRDADERPRPGVEVFLDLNTNGKLDGKEPLRKTDRNGRYRFENLSPGRYWLGAITPQGVQQSFPAPVSEFDVELVVGRGVSEEKLAVIRSAADRWEEVIVGDLPDANGADDLKVKVEAKAIDGADDTLAIAYATAFRRKGSELPYMAKMSLDATDLAPMPDEELFTLALHEIGHALGFGTVWEDKGLILGAGRRNPRFIGKRAVEVYRDLVGDDTLTAVPVERKFGLGTRDAHWALDDPLLGDEALTGFITPGSPLSAVTIASLEDLGYQVNLAAADALDGTPREHLATVSLGESETSFYDVEVVEGQTVSRDFGYTPLAEVRGTVRSTRGTPLSDRRVFLDADFDRKWDDGELVGLTDLKGRYAIDGVPPGTYAVTVERGKTDRGDGVLVHIMLGQTVRVVDLLES